MSDKSRVLVTGAGSGVGQGIIKSLRLSGLDITVIAADIAPTNAGLYFCDEAILIPRLEDDGAFDILAEILQSSKIDVLMVGSEYDLNFFSRHQLRLQELTDALIIVSPWNTVRIADDKWLTAEFLKQHGLPYAEALIPDSEREAVELAKSLGYPLILKSRSGTSARHVYLCEDEADLVSSFKLTPMPMLQKLINKPSSELNFEYTCSVFKDQGGNILGPFTSRRTLKSGTSWQIEVAHFDVAADLCLAVASKIDFMGSLNIQLMVNEFGDPIPFEFNARFSGTTAVRAHFGFNEPEMALRSFYYNQKLDKPLITSGVAFRYYEEVFIDGLSANELAEGHVRGQRAAWI